MVSRVVYITLKDHTHNFQNYPTLRLLNPAENEFNKIIKTMLDKVNVNLRNSLHLNQLKNAQEVGLVQRHYTFIMFNIKDFYASISKELLTDSITFAETIINLDDHDKKIKYSRKSLLLNQEQKLMKKGSDLFV